MLPKPCIIVSRNDAFFLRPCPAAPEAECHQLLSLCATPIGGCRLSSNQFSGGFLTGLATYPNLTFLLLNNNDFRWAAAEQLE